MLVKRIVFYVVVFIVAVALSVLLNSRFDNDRVFHTGPVSNSAGCMMEPSNTPEGYEIISYDRLWPDDDYEGFQIPCPKGN